MGTGSCRCRSTSNLPSTRNSCSLLAFVVFEEEFALTAGGRRVAAGSIAGVRAGARIGRRGLRRRRAVRRAAQRHRRGRFAGGGSAGAASGGGLPARRRARVRPRLRERDKRPAAPSAWHRPACRSREFVLAPGRCRMAARVRRSITPDCGTAGPENLARQLCAMAIHCEPGACGAHRFSGARGPANDPPRRARASAGRSDGNGTPEAPNSGPREAAVARAQVTPGR